MTAVVDHPEVPERLEVHECVVRVACPQCKVKAGTPCKGARFYWLARGTRRGFRYKQETHAARRTLYQGWKQAGRPARLPVPLVESLTTVHGSFSRKLDRKTELSKSTKKVSTKCAKPAPKSKPKSQREGRLRHIQIEHKGCIWEGIKDNLLWSWMPYIENKNYTHISVFDFPAHLGGVRLSFKGHEHKCESREAAFDLAIELVVKAALLGVFNERIDWRIQELERQFGHMLEGVT